jgi:hypothetical protein
MALSQPIGEFSYQMTSTTYSETGARINLRGTVTGLWNGGRNLYSQPYAVPPSGLPVFATEVGDPVSPGQALRVGLSRIENGPCFCLWLELEAWPPSCGACGMLDGGRPFVK